MHLPCKQAYVGALPTDSTNLSSDDRRSEFERRVNRQSINRKSNCGELD